MTYNIECEVILVPEGGNHCRGSAKMKLGDKFIIGLKTPEGLCAKVFAHMYPIVNDMRKSDETQWEKEQGYCDVVCPDTRATYRLSRMKE